MPEKDNLLNIPGTYKYDSGLTPFEQSKANVDSFNPNYLADFNRQIAANAPKSDNITHVDATEVDNTGRFPFVMPGADNEEIYGQGQGLLSKAGHGVTKGLGIAATTFLQGTAGLVNGVAQAVKDKQFSSFYNNDFNRSLDNFNKQLENSLPNYYTHGETDADWYSPKEWATGNFIFDKLIKNTGFAVGAIAAGGAWSTALKGIGLVGQLVKAGNSLEVASLEAAETAMINAPKAERLSTWMSSLKDLAQKTGANVLQNTDRGLTAFMGTTGEAGMEALQNLNQHRTELIDDYKKKYGIASAGEELDKINKSAESVGNASFGLNTALLTFTNYIQFPKILGSTVKGEKALINEELNGITHNAAGDFEATQLKVAARRYAQAKSVVKLFASPSEAFEEGAQNVIQEGVSNYYKKGYEGKPADFLDDAVGYGVSQTLSTKGGMESILLGGLTGGLMESGIISNKGIGKTGVIGEQGILGEGGKKALNTVSAVTELNKTPKFISYFKEQVAAVKRAEVLQGERADAIRQGDVLESKDLEYDYTHNYLQPRIKYGKFDAVIDDINMYRKLAATDAGWLQLQTEGVVTAEDTQAAFQERLNNTEDHANFVKDTYKLIQNKYSGLISKTTGERVYSDDTIDQMVYAAAKINDYNKRLQQVNINMSPEYVLAYTDAIQQAEHWALAPNPSRETNLHDAVATFIKTIDDKNIPDVEKEDLKQTFADAIEMTIRKQGYMHEYNDIKRNPQSAVRDYLNNPATEAEKQPGFSINGKDYVINREYESKEPVGEYTVRKMKVDGKWAVFTPDKKVVDSFEEEDKARNLAATMSKPLASFGKITILSKAGGQVKIRDEKGKIHFIDPSLISDHQLVKTEEEILANGTAIQQAFTDLQQDLEKDQPGIPTLPVDAERMTTGGDFELGAPRKKNFVQATASATVTPEQIIGDLDRARKQPPVAHNRHIREQHLLTALMADLTLHAQIQTIPITYNNQKQWGFDFIELSYTRDKVTVDNTKDFVNGAIARIYVIKQGDKWFTVDHEGKPIAEIGEKQDPNNFIYTYQENASADRNGQDKAHNLENYSTEQLKELLEQAKLRRQQTFENPDAVAQATTFDISGGVINLDRNPDETRKYSRNAVVDSGLVSQAQLSQQGLIEVPTVEKADKKGYGVVTGSDGKQYTVRIGAPVLLASSGVYYLNSRKINQAEASNVFDVLKYAARQIMSGKSVPMNIREYLSSIIYTSTASKKSAFYFDKDSIVINGIPHTLTQAALDADKGVIVKAIQELYHNTNWTRLQKDIRNTEPYYEVISVDQDGPKFRVWKSYQHYLLSPSYEIANGRDTAGEQGKARKDVPLTTTVRKTQEFQNTGFNELPVMQRYVTLDNYFEYIPTIKTLVTPPAAQPSLKLSTTYGDQVIDGKTLNTIDMGNGVQIVYSAELDTVGDMSFSIYDQPGQTTSLLMENSGAAANQMLSAILLPAYEEYKKTTTPTAPAAPAETLKLTTKYGDQIIDGKTINTIDMNPQVRMVYTAEVDKDGDLTFAFYDRPGETTPILMKNGAAAANQLLSAILEPVFRSSTYQQLQALAAVPTTNQPVAPLNNNQLFAQYQSNAGAFTPVPGGSAFRMINGDEVVDKVWDQKVFKDWMANNLPQFNINTLKTIIKTSGGGFAWGAQRAKYIYLFEGAPAGTEWHEAFEGVWNSFLSPAEQEDLYKEFTSRPGSFIDRESGVSLPYSTASTHQAKEQMAEEFGDYRELEEANGPKQKSFFERLFDFIRQFIFRKPNTMENLFERIGASYYRNAVFSSGPTTTSYRLRGKGIAEAWLNDVMHHMTDLLTVQAKVDGNLIQMQQGKVPTAEVYNKLYNNLRNYYENGIAKTGPDAPFPNLSEDHRMKLLVGDGAGFKGWDYIKNNWNTFVQEHQGFIKPRGLTFKDSVDNYELQETENKEALTIPAQQEQIENKNSREYDRDTRTINPFASASQAVRMIFSTATQQTYHLPVNEGLDITTPVLSSVGGRILVDSAAEFYKVMNAVSGSRNHEDMQERFEQLATLNPNLVTIYKTFYKKEPHARTADDWTLITQLWNATGGKQTPLVYLQISDENGRIHQIDAGAAGQVGVIIENWASEQKKTDSPLSVKLEDGTYAIDTSKIKTNVTNADTALSFLAELSFPLDKNVYDRLTKKDKEVMYRQVTQLAHLYKNAGVVTADRSTEFVSRFKKLAELVVKVNGDRTSGSYVGGDGNLYQQNIQSNYISKMDNWLNNATSREELLDQRPALSDVWSRNSLLLAQDQWVNNVRVKPVHSSIVDGLRDKNGEYIDLAKAPLAIKVMREFNMNLSNGTGTSTGVYYTLLPADSKTEWAQTISHYITHADYTSDWKGAREAIFVGYLKDEIDLIKDQDNKARKSNEEISKNADKLRFFKDMLSPTNRKLVEDYANGRLEVSLSTEDFVRDFLPELNRDLETHFEALIDRQIQFLVNNRLIQADTSKSAPTFTWLGLDAEGAALLGKVQGQLTSEDIRDIVRFRTLNYVIHNTELHKVFFGDPAQYKDATKRIKSFMSGREATYFGDEEYNTSMSTHLNKVAEDIELEQGDPGYINFSEEFNAETVDHGDSVATTIVSANYEEYRKALGDRSAGYEAVVEPDAQSWGSPHFFAEYTSRTGGLSANQKEFIDYDNALARHTLAAEGKYEYTNEALRKYDEERIKHVPIVEGIWPIIKPIGSGTIEREGVMEAQLLKTSTFPLFFSFTQPGSGMRQMYEYMWDYNVHYIGPKSQHKVGYTKNLQPLYDITTGLVNTEGMADSNAMYMPWEHFGKQVETAGQHDKQTLISQLTTLYEADFFSAGVPVDFKGTKDEWNSMDETTQIAVSEVKAIQVRNKKALSGLINTGYQTILRKLGISEENNSYHLTDANKLVSFLKASLTRREVADNLIEALNVSYNSEISEYELTTPLEALPNYKAIKNILWSLADKEIVRPGLNGGQKVQVSAALWENNIRQAVYKNGNKWEKVEDYAALNIEQQKTVRLSSSELKFYTMSKDGKKIEAMEVLLPNWFRKKLSASSKLKAMSDKELINYLNSTGEGRKILTGVGARIPVQGANSAEVFIVKGFLPAALGEAIVVPSEITTKAGSDFDVDKLNTYLKNIYIDSKEGIKTVPHFQSVKEAFEFVRSGEMLDNTAFESTDELLNTLLTEVGLAGKLNDQDKKDATIAREIYRQGLENEYFQSLEDMLTRPENFKRLLMPNTTEDTVKVGEEIASARKEKKTERAKGDVDYSFLTNPMAMSTLRHINLIMKDGVGIAASANKFFAGMQGANVGVLGGVMFPHNRIEVNGKKYMSLSEVFDKEGMYILDKISQAINGAVDAAKDPWLARLLGFSEALPVALYMSGVGIGLENTYWFINQPIVQAYLQEKSIQRTLSAMNPAFVAESDKKIVAALKARFGVKQQPKATDVGDFKLDRLKSMVAAKEKGLNNQDRDLQGLILSEFKKYEDYATTMFQMQQGVNWDSAFFSSNSAVMIRSAQWEQAAELESAGEITGLNQIMTGSRAAVKDHIEQARDAFQPIFISENDTAREALDYIMDFYSDPSLRISGDVKLKVMQQAEQSLVDFSIMNFAKLGGRPMNSYIYDLFLGPNNIVEQLRKIKSDVHGDIAQNTVLQQLISIVQNNTSAAKNIGIITKLSGVFEQNSFTAAMRELRDHPQTSGFYRDIVLAGIIQNGVSSNRTSFNQYMPSEDYSFFTSQGVEQIRMANVDINIFAKLYAFQRANWQDKNIVPTIQRRYSEEQGQWVLPYLRDKELDKISEKGYSFLSLPVNSREARYPVVKIVESVINPATSKQYTTAEKKKMAAARNYSFQQVKLFQKIPGLPLEKTVVYKQINAWGDTNVQEYYLDNRPSVLATNAKVNEVADSQIYNVFNGYIEAEPTNNQNSNAPAIDKEVTIKKDENNSWTLTVKPDGTVINKTTGKTLDPTKDKKLINKAYLKSGYLAYEMVTANNGNKYAVIPDGRAFTMAATTMGTEIQSVGLLKELRGKAKNLNIWSLYNNKIQANFPEMTEAQFKSASKIEQERIVACL